MNFYLFSILKSILVIIFYAPKLTQILSPSDCLLYAFEVTSLVTRALSCSLSPTTCPRLAFNFSSPSHRTIRFSKCPRTFQLGVVFRTKIWEQGMLITTGLSLFLSPFSQQSCKILFKLQVHIDVQFKINLSFFLFILYIFIFY